MARKSGRYETIDEADGRLLRNQAVDATFKLYNYYSKWADSLSSEDDPIYWQYIADKAEVYGMLGSLLQNPVNQYNVNDMVEAAADLRNSGNAAADRLENHLQGVSHGKRY